MQEGIISYKPFLAIYNFYTGKTYRFTFKCPICGSNSCHRSSLDKASISFFEGNFICDNCLQDRVNLNGKELYFNYYGPCWIEEELFVPKQLSLF